VVSEDPINLNDIGGTWAFPQRLILSSADLAHINSLTIREANMPAFANWAFSHGGYAPNTDTQLIVENNRSYPVRIIDMNVAKSCGPPLTGTLLFSPNAGGDADIRLGFNLDSDNTEAYAATGWDATAWKPDYFANFTVSVNPGSQQVFNLRTVVSKFSCQFQFKMTVLDGKKKVTELMDDQGQPFRVSAGLPNFSRYSVLYVGGVENPAGNDSYVRVNPKTFHP
jgi:hypothetical protein